MKHLLGLALFVVSHALATPNSIELPKNLLPLPLVRQATDYSCGPASLLSVMMYWGVFDGVESDTYKALGTTPEDGTHPRKLVEYAQKMGLSASMKTEVTIDELRAALSRGETLILDIQAWKEDKTRSWAETWEDGHYIVLAGIDDKNIYAMDPVLGTSYGFIPIPELLERWHDYEDHSNRMWKNYQLAVFISGKTPLSAYPKSPQYIQ